MKKLLLVLAIGAFVACNDSTTENESSNDTTTILTPDTTTMPPATLDTTTLAPADSTMKSDPAK